MHEDSSKTGTLPAHANDDNAGTLPAHANDDNAGTLPAHADNDKTWTFSVYGHIEKENGIGISYNKRKVLTILQEQIWVLSFVHTKRDNKNECEEDKWLLLN